MAIYYTGMKILSGVEQSQVKNILETEYPRLVQIMPKKQDLKVMIKSYDNAGTRKKYSMHLRLGGSFQAVATEAADWDLKRTTHKAVKNLEKEMDHRFRRFRNPLHCAARQLLGLH